MEEVEECNTVLTEIRFYYLSKHSSNYLDCH